MSARLEVLAAALSDSDKSKEPPLHSLRGSDIAQFNLAAMYYEGRGVLGQWSRAQKAVP